MKEMTGRERFLTVLNKEKPDRMACQVHSWMSYYLKTYLKDMDQYAAYDYFGMDPVIYVEPKQLYAEKDLAHWEIKLTDLGRDAEGNHAQRQTITTPKGILTAKFASNQYTSWVTEHLIKTEADFALWETYCPVPIGTDWSPVLEAKVRIGDRGIVRGAGFSFGQGSPWQSFAGVLYSMEDAILATYDDPDWVHHVMEVMTTKQVSGIERAGRIEYDLVETGGGAGSSTVISPNLHREYCLPYDRRIHEALHAGGTKTVYHLCGGLMPLLEIVAENGSDGLETMTPVSMGGDCDLPEASRRVGSRLFTIGGFDQNAGFEKGNPQKIREMVFELFEACPQGSYICSPSDHFFYGDPANIQAFVAAVKECRY